MMVGLFYFGSKKFSYCFIWIDHTDIWSSAAFSNLVEIHLNTLAQYSS